jgi:hypothetical protein
VLNPDDTEARKDFACRVSNRDGERRYARLQFFVTGGVPSQSYLLEIVKDVAVRRVRGGGVTVTGLQLNQWLDLPLRPECSYRTGRGGGVIWHPLANAHEESDGPRTFSRRDANRFPPDELSDEHRLTNLITELK